MTLIAYKTAKPKNNHLVNLKNDGGAYCLRIFHPLPKRLFSESGASSP